jgi:hypothetical protein
MLTAPIGFVDAFFHRLGDRVGIHDDLAMGVAGGRPVT